MTDWPLKLLYLSIEYPPESPNGIGSYVAETAAAVAALGQEVHVLSCIPGQEPRDYLDGDVRIHRRGERGYGRYTAVRVQHAAACWREARKLGIDWDVESPDWMAEIVDGSAGGVVPPGDAEALAEALRPLLVDPDAAASAGARAREQVERECAPSRVAERREHLYRQVAEAGRPRRRFRR
jgi:hypothetical protein